MNSRLLSAAGLGITLLGFTSCGGGSNGAPPVPPPPPPAADFALVAETATVITQQGGALQFQTIQANPLNGFAGQIAVTLSGLPAGITTTPSAPPSITITGQGQGQTSFQLAASPTTPIGATTVSVTGTSGSIKHTIPFTLTVTQAAQFTIHISPASVALTPASNATINVSVIGAAGTSPQLGVNVSGPTNATQIVTGTPQGFLTPTNPLSFSINATALAQPLANFPVVITASDNSNNTSVAVLPLTVTVPFSSNTSPTRSTFVRTDKAPTGMVYDPQRKLLFVSVEILNEVQVLSSVDGHQIASIPVSFPAGIDEAADGSAVYVVSPYFGGVTIIDPNLLQVVEHSDVPQSVSGLPLSVTFFQVAALSNGKVVLSPTFDMVDLTKPPFYSWDPKAKAYARFGPASFQPSALMSRNADHSKLIASGAAAGGILYDANTDQFVGPTPLIGGDSAVNSDGSQIVSTTYQNSAPVFAFYDSQLNLLGTLPLNAFSVSGPNPALFYSVDGSHLYIVPNQGIGFGNAAAVASVVDTKTFAVVGLVPGFSFGALLPFSGQWITTFAIDETNMLFGAAFQGVGFLDMNSPTSLQEPLPGPFLVQPSLASLSTPTAAQLAGAGFSQGSSIFNLFIGPPPTEPHSLQATNVSVQSVNFVNLNIPAGNLPGPANATLTRSDGFFEVMPDAVSFGPTILQVDADSGSSAGGDTVKIVGYGLAASNAQVTIGGKQASIVHTAGAISGQLFPTEIITVTTPPGLPGLADVTVSTPDGSATHSGSFQYLNSVQVYPIVGALDAIIYDSSRKRLYLSNEDHNRVETFDLSTNAFLSPVSVGNAPTSLALTPDGQRLAVANSADGTVSVIDPSKLQVTATYPLLTAADQNIQGCGGVVTQISLAAPHRMLVSVNCTSSEQGGLSHLINLDTGSLSCVGVTGCASNGTDFTLGLGAPVMASSLDGTRIFFTANNVGVLDLTANTLITGPGGSYADAAISSDGNVVAADFGTYDARVSRISIMAFEPYADSGSQSFHNVIGEKLNPSGSLLFYPQDSGVDIFDVHTGRLVRHLVLPDPIPLDTNGMVLDETGSKMFLISNTGVTVVQLSQVPLSLATLNPASAPSGTTVTVRGSGFQSGATITFGNVQASTTFVDSNTLQGIVPSLSPGPIRVSVKNPDGRQYSLDAAFTVN